MLYLTNVYGARYGASALAANGVLRYMLGGSFPLFALSSALHPANPFYSHTLLVNTNEP